MYTPSDRVSYQGIEASCHQWKVTQTIKYFKQWVFMARDVQHNQEDIDVRTHC